MICKKKKHNRNKKNGRFWEGKNRRRNKRKIAEFGREKLEMTSLQADLIVRERNRKFVGKLDLLFFYLLQEIEKLS